MISFSISRPIHAVMIGAGGTGAHIAPHLYRLLWSLYRPSTFLIADGDIVERGNLVRQNFIEADLGRNKARVLAERYSAVFGMENRYVDHYVEDEATLTSLLQPEQPSLCILIGAVDNNRSRQLCDRVFHSMRDLIYIDAGNGVTTGQVVCGVRKSGKTVCKPLAGYYRDVLSPTDKFPTELSCEEAAISSPQAITANLTAATLTLNMLYNILAKGELDTKMATFSTRTIHVRPTLHGRKAA